MSQNLPGASVSAHSLQPSINLALTVKALVDTLTSMPNQLLGYDNNGCLRIDTSKILSNLSKQTTYAHCKEKGFVQDLPPLKRYLSARVGGRIVSGTEGDLKDSIHQLSKIITEELSQLTNQGLKLENLVVPNPGNTLGKMAIQFGAQINKTTARSLIQPVVFSKFEKSGQDSKSDIGRVVAAVEVVRGDHKTWSQDLIKAMRQESVYQNVVQAEAEPVLNDYLEQASTPGSQLNTFLNFLEDEALSRVRLQVGFKIMEAIAEQAAANMQQKGQEQADIRLFIEYVDRASKFQNRILSPDHTEVLVRVTKGFEIPEFKLSSEFCKATFYTCLPVWPDAHAQMFEKRVDAEQGPALWREISYRFRINGKDPETKTTAFVSRLARIRQKLFENNEVPVTPRTVAELIYLWNVIPDGKPVPAKPGVPVNWLEPLDRLEKGGRDVAEVMLKELEARAEITERIAQTFVRIIKQSGSCVPDPLRRHIVSFYLSLRKNLVNWIKCFSEGTPDPLVSLGNDTVAKTEWLRHLDVYETPDPTSLFSVQVKTRLSEHRLAVVGQPLVIQANRELPSEVIQILWHSSDLKIIEANDWAFPQRIELLYNDKWLGSSKNLDEPQEIGLAIFRTAFTILVETALVTILHAVKRVRPEIAPVSLVMFRIQTGGEETNIYSGSQFIYACGQSIEQALGRNWHIRGQGLVDPVTQVGKTALPYKKKNALGAIYSGFPLVFGRTTPGKVEKFGAIVFSSRPCDEHPSITTDESGSILIGKTYLAESYETKQSLAYRLTCGHLLDIGFGSTVFEKPPAVMEAIRQFYDQGCRHVVLLAHRYGGRSMGRSALRHRHHESPAFLKEVASRFPDLHLFPLARDTFPAVRLRRRGEQESGFEVIGTANHVPGSSMVREGHGMVPLYTLATLRFVGKDDNARPQSGFSTYFFIKDDLGLELFEWREQTSALLFGDNPSVRNDLVSLLRGIHFLESELPAEKGQVFPILDPYQWMAPSAAAGVGDIIIRKKTSNSGQIILSLHAILARIHNILDLETKNYFT